MLRQTVWGNALFSVDTYWYTSDPPVNYNYNPTINPHDVNLIFYPHSYQPNNDTTCSCKINPTTCNVLSSVTYANETVNKI
ncbi:unnamed protein product [Adineta steineri]|nr:unnamed protein product [Adineta steineri]